MPRPRLPVPAAATEAAARRRGYRIPCSSPARAVLLAALVGCATASHGADLSELDGLIAAGTSRLALAVIDSDQPPPTQDLDGWMAWETRRLDLLHDRQAWAALEQRVARHPDDLPRPFLEHSRTLRAEAALVRGDGATARAELRSLIWQAGGDASADLPRWRELVIRSYLADGLHEDAHLAMVRYRQDHGRDDPRLRELAVRILLRSGRPTAALAALGDADDPTADALRLLAQLRSGQLPAATVRDTAEQRARAVAGDAPSLAATRYWAVAVEAAADQTAARVAMLEAGLPARDPPAAEALFVLTPEQLWQAYRAHGEALGNRAQLLVGQDVAWFELASDRADTEPLDARALFATLARIARDPALRQASQIAFANALAEAPRGPLLLRRLYLDEPPLLAVESLPIQLRQRLADGAVASGDPATALRLLDTLDGPPPDADPFAWHRQRAELRVRAGDPRRGGAELVRLVTAQPQRATAEVAALLPAAQALQRAGAHAQAVALLESLLRTRQDDSAHRRALLLALADSQHALQRPVVAARLYLRAADLAEAQSGDRLGHEARHRAAQALIEAGFPGDARRLLQRLIATSDGGERTALEQELARLPGQE